MPAAVESLWSALKDDDLLKLRICDLGVRIEQSDLEARIGQLYGELAARGVPLRPDCYLGDEWFSPDGVPAIAIPFYLAHSRDSRPWNSIRCWKWKEEPRNGARCSCGTNVATPSTTRINFPPGEIGRPFSAAPKPSMCRKLTRRDHTVRVLSAISRTGTRRRTRTKISPRHSQFGWQRRLMAGGKVISGWKAHGETRIC